jgi:hypothetical protein
MQTTHAKYAARNSAPLHFFWIQRQDGAEALYCRQADGSITRVISPEEVASDDQLIAELSN